MKIQMTRGNGIFQKITFESQNNYYKTIKEKKQKIFRFLFYYYYYYFPMMLIYPGFQQFPCLANIKKITKTTKNKISTTEVILNRNKNLRKREFNFVNLFKGDFEANS